MAELPPVHQRIILDASGVPAAVAQTTAGLKTISGATKTAGAAMSGFAASMKAAMKGLLLIGGIMAITGAIRGMRDEAIASEVEGQRLDLALTNIGVTSEKDKESIAGLAGSFEQLGFGGSEATNAMGTLVTATGSVDQATKLMSISADYARNRHISLSQAADIMAKATQGNVKAFKAMGITLDENLPKNQAIAKAFDELNGKIGGSATGYLDTFAGRMAVLREKFEAFIENGIGAVLPYITAFMGAMIKAADWIAANATPIKIYIGLLLLIAGALKVVTIWEAIVALLDPFRLMIIGIVLLGVAFVMLWNKFAAFRTIVVTGLSLMLKYWGYLIGYIATVLRMWSNVPGMGFLKSAADWADKAAIKVGKLGDEIVKLKDKKLEAPKTPTLAEFTTPGDDTGIEGNVQGGDATAGGKGGKGSVQYVTVYASNTNDIARKLSAAARNGLPVGGY